MFKIHNKNTRTTSLTYFTPTSSVSIVDFKQANVSCLYDLQDNSKLVEELEMFEIKDTSNYHF